MAGYWPRSFMRFYVHLDQKKRKKERGQYQVNLTSRLVNKRFIIRPEKENIYLQDQRGIASWQDALG